MLKIRSIMLCEDVRREENGKEFIIGVYSGGITFYAEPGKLRQLCFRIDLEQDSDEESSTLDLEVTTPSGARFIKANSQIVAKKGRGALTMTHLDTVMYEAGTYAIKVSTESGVYEDTINVLFQPRKRGVDS